MSHPYGRNSPQTTRTKTGTGRELAATARGNRARTSWQPPLAPTTPTRPDGTRPASQNRAHYVVHFAPNATLSAHVTEADCTLSTTPTIHRTTPPCNGGFCDHRTPVTACRRRVAPLWSQFPPDNKTKDGNRARTSWQPPLAPTTPTRPTTLTKPTTLTRPDGTPPASRTYAQNVVHFDPNTTFSAHPAEVDCTLSTTPTIHHTTPPRNGGFYYHRTPVTACRRRVAPLWSQFPPDNKNKRGNSARAAYHPTHQRR